MQSGSTQKIFAILALVILVLAIALIISIVQWRKEVDKNDEASVSAPTIAPSTAAPTYVTTTDAYRFSKAAVAADSKYCSDIGKDILSKGGNAIDGAIAALICCGVVQVHSTGIGGGGFMTIYIAKLNKSIVLDYRETGPAALRSDSYNANHDLSKVGGLAVGVPGEIRGLRHAWGKYGNLPWSTLIQPSIDLARNGTKISPHMSRAMASSSTTAYINNDPGLKELLVNADGSMKTEGDVITNEKYAKTLEIIRDNPEDLYTGSLAQTFINEVNAKGGSMTADDLKDYKVLEKEPITAQIGNLTFYTTPMPGGGTVLSHIINMAKGYNFQGSDLTDMSSKILTYHRIVEIFKFSYAIRPRLGDPNGFVDPSNITKAVQDALNITVADMHREKINDSSTQDIPYYSDYFLNHDSQGTTHVSVLDQDGNAVSATDTINYSFGAKFRSTQSGIVYNNELADFFHNGSYAGYATPVANQPGPGKRPLSSTCPNIAVDSNGVVRMVSGASGGTRITLSTAWVIIMHQIFGIELGAAVNLGRPQHALFPNYIRNEKLMPMAQEMIDGLKSKNHEVRNSGLSAIVQAIIKDQSGELYAKSDPRKNGVPAGF